MQRKVSEPSTIVGRHIPWEDCERRWPRLVKACQHAAILSASEAACCLRDYRLGRHAVMGLNPYAPYAESHMNLAEGVEWGEMMLRFGGGEAVSHYGGPRAVIGAAIRHRHMYREFAKGNS